MPAPRRVTKQVFILVPEEDQKSAVLAAQRACRVAHAMGLNPMSPALYFRTFLSTGELSMELRRLSLQWLKRTDRIWLQYPNDDCDRLDPLSYEILEENQRLSSRRPVYQLHSVNTDDKIGFVPVAMLREEVDDLLAVNLTSSLARHCM